MFLPYLITGVSFYDVFFDNLDVRSFILRRVFNILDVRGAFTTCF